MSELTKNIEALYQEIKAAYARLNIKALIKQCQVLEKETQEPHFWNDSMVAQSKMKQLALLQSQVNPWVKLSRGIQELKDLNDLNDQSLQEEIASQLEIINKEYIERKKELSYSGPYDDHDAILTIYAGAGGTDAQDWAQMLLRMYSRWAESVGATPLLVEKSDGEEAGIKSATLEISAPYAFGKLKGEHGVHRLVRLSPFNSDNLRQTSFAKVDVLPKIESPDEVEIEDKDLKIDVFRAGGHGGQSVNTTDSAVRVTHIPTGITVSIQNERSQLQNKETALIILRSRLAKLKLEQHQDRLSDIKGPTQSAEWGNQIRSYVLHPYKQVKDTRTKFEVNDPDKVLDGDLNGFIEAYQEHNLT